MQYKECCNVQTTLVSPNPSLRTGLFMDLARKQHVVGLIDIICPTLR